MPRLALRKLTAALAAAISGGVVFAADQMMDSVVVTAIPMSDPLTVVTDPKAPRQPVPAHDGADYLKTIPGFNVIRKGGTDGDPVLRGMAGSRLNILLDGEQILGGCGGRMDPPTAYVFPESYDRITVLKGPQTVAYGPGNSAGTVLFERDVKRFKEAGWKFSGSLTFGSFGRNDQVADIRAGNPDFYVQGIATRTDANDYEDGDGKLVHSRYTRWSEGLAFGWTPDDDTRLELSAIRSDGKAAYADRGVDGSKFDRENLGLKFEKRRVSALVEKLEAQAYYNYIDHVMDSYSMRTGNPASMMAAMNPDRKTTGGRVAAILRLADPTRLKLGLDLQDNRHTSRTGRAPGYPMSYDSQPRTEDANFSQRGLFGELTHLLGEQDRIVAGLRNDRWEAQDKRQMLALTMMVAAANPTANQRRSLSLTSGFARYEHDLAAGSTAYAGLGRVERFPDFWELMYKEGPATADISAFATTRPEKTTQLDVGATWKRGSLSGSVSGFYGDVDDYILIQSNVVRSNAPYGMGNRTVSIVRNVAATTWGGEAGLGYQLNDRWKLDGSLAYVRGTNDTDGTALAQLPPLELRLGANYDDRAWSYGALLRLVAEQDRIDPNKGNIAGQDIGRTAGFGIFSLNAGYRPRKGVLIAAGIDNLFDKTYAEHISRAGTMVAGYTQTTRINEPGRNAWVRASIALD